MGVKQPIYFPYFRGKQYELVAVRELAPLMTEAGFAPIIEPVREQTAGLRKALDCMAEAKTPCVVILNPQIGDHSDDGKDLVSFISDNFADYSELQLGYLLTEGMDAGQVVSVCGSFDQNRQLALIHAGFSDPKNLAKRIPSELPNAKTQVFLEDYCGKLYQRHFKKLGLKVLVRDGCIDRKRNKDHPDHPEFFSDLHVTYVDEGVDAFGDFTMVGDDYTEGGGPAYTVAIHLTFIDHDSDDEMHIQHFKSDRQETPKDPAGKFHEALNKLVTELRKPGSNFYATTAIKEFEDLHDRGHYPGLGYVKKLSMKHHVETLATYFESAGDSE